MGDVSSSFCLHDFSSPLFSMFLFLSKLLPLFIYPVGLSCLLLVIAMATFWKRPRLAAGAVGAALGILLFSSNQWVANALLAGLESQYPPLPANVKGEAIVLLGGSTYGLAPPRQWPEVTEAGDRIIYTARLYREGRAPKVVVSGGRISWQGSAPSEAEDIKIMLEFMGVPPTVMALDRTSLNTYENAVNTKAILNQAQLNGPVLLVTSSLHMPRSMAIFKKLGIPVIAAPTDYLVDSTLTPKGLADFVLQLLPSAEATYRTTAALKEHIGLWIYRLKGWA
jgi:uncharacterized SAM-binding protein YcdF (DUF218 family)